MTARLRGARAAALFLLGSACASVSTGRSGGAPLIVDALLLHGDASEAQEHAITLVERKPRDPWARLNAALLARRAADPAQELSQLLALVAAEPSHPLALVALRRIAELADESAPIARAVESGLVGPLASGKLTGFAAYRARVARIASAEVLGDRARVVRLRAENGAVTAWTLAGPFGLHHALDFVRSFPPDGGVLPEAASAPLGGAPRPTRTLPAPDGTLTLEGEPPDGDVFYLGADVTLKRGGRYLLVLRTSMSVKVQVDGALVHERRDFAAHLPSLVEVPIALGAGIHRVLVKAARSGDHSGLFLALAREDGSASDASAAPAAFGTPPPHVSAPTVGAAVQGARAIAASLEHEAGPGVARYLAALDAAPVDLEAAKALLAEAAQSLPGSAAVRVARAAVLQSDPTLDDQTAQSRAEAELREALAMDPGHVAARIALAGLLRHAGRLDEADEVLAASKSREPNTTADPAPLGSPPPAYGNPTLASLGLALARNADARGLSERAEVLVAQVLGAGGSCRALELGRDLAARRRSVQLEDERVRALAECRGGRQRLAEHLQRRGDPRGAIELLLPVVRTRPWALEPALALAGAYVAAGAHADAIASLEALRAIWPRSTRVEKMLADVRELGGDKAGARAARERALLIDGGDLDLRRALALEDGREVLDTWAENATSAIRAYEATRRTEDTSSVLVLDAAAVEFHPGGALTERTHQVVHVLDPHGVEQFGDVSIPSGAELLVLRTLKSDGRALEPERSGGREMISLTGLEPGDYVELEYVRGVRGDGLGVSADPFFFRAGDTRLFRSTYVVAAPEGLGLAVDAHGMAPLTSHREGGREVVRARADDVPAHVPEPNQPPLTEILPWLHVGIGGGREVVHAALADMVAGKTRSTEELRALARRVRDDAGKRAPPLELARAAWARVSSMVLGSGGPFGDDASEVLSRGRGSRLLVLKALLAELGIRSRIALARPFGSDASPRRFPSPLTWNYPLLRIEVGGKVLWHDPSLRVAPLGTVPSPVLGVEALVLPEPGEPLEVVQTPERAAIEERRELAIRVNLAADGSATIECEDRYRGAAGAAAKMSVERLDAAERRQLVEESLAHSFRGASLVSAEILGENDPQAPFVVRWRATAAALARPANGALVLDSPLVPASLGARFVQVAARATPLVIDVGEVVDARIEIVAPAGFMPEAAPSRTVADPFGTFSREERANGAMLVRNEQFVLHRARIAPDRYPEFAAFAAGVDHLQERPTTFVGRDTERGVPAAVPAGSRGPAPSGSKVQ